jgi:L-ribulose-5-phosphate 3-epimerase
MTLRVGIMQGRLSPPSAKRIQEFPWASWQDEFPRARQLGFDTIEWLFEDERHPENPVWTKAGRQQIRDVVERSGVAVHSLCADYFMPNPFFRVSAQARQHNISVLQRLIEHAAEIGVKLILIPVLEISAVTTEREADELVAALLECLPDARASNVSLGLETELPVEKYAALIERISDPAVGAYYDVGNAAAQGYDCARDIARLGGLIKGVHAKDRLLRGGTVALGQGAARYPEVVRALQEMAFRGTLVLQTAFGPDYTHDAARNLRFIRELWDGSGTGRQ